MHRSQACSAFGQLALRRLRSAPDHAPGCPELRPASASLGQSAHTLAGRTLVQALISTQVRTGVVYCTARMPPRCALRVASVRSGRCARCTWRMGSGTSRAREVRAPRAHRGVQPRGECKGALRSGAQASGVTVSVCWCPRPVRRLEEEALPSATRSARVEPSRSPPAFSPHRSRQCSDRCQPPTLRTDLAGGACSAVAGARRHAQRHTRKACDQPRRRVGTVVMLDCASAPSWRPGGLSARAHTAGHLVHRGSRLVHGGSIWPEPFTHCRLCFSELCGGGRARGRARSAAGGARKGLRLRPVW